MTSRIPNNAINKYKKLRDDFSFFANACLKIRTKSGQVSPFLMNATQKYVHQRIEEQRKRTGRVRALIVKARQQGISTYVNGRFYHRVTHSKGKRCFILTHEQSATEELFSMVERFHDNIQYDMRPETGASNAKELYFNKLDSGYKVGTAGNKSVGRGSTIQFFHGSEVAFWPNDQEHAAGVLQAVPDMDGTEVILESTGNGMNNLFYRMCMEAMHDESQYQIIFVPWYMSEEYRADSHGFENTEEEELIARQFSLQESQLVWRRNKLKELGVYKFSQEYPSTPQEAFQTSGDESFIQAELVMGARRRQAPGFGPIVLGVDPAGEGKDRTAMVWRQGEKMLASEVYNFVDEMEIVGMVVKELNGGVDQAMIDGVGLGSGIISRLKELGYGSKIKNVKGGARPDNTSRFFNKRAECWGLMRDWLETGSLEDDDGLHMDLTSLQWKYDSSGRVQLESKQDLRRRGLSSPDKADALAYTFAYPVISHHDAERRVMVKKDELWN